MKLYKLTDEYGRTYGNTQWGVNVKHVASGNPSSGLCSNAYIHAYRHPLLAVLFNPIHAKYSSPQLWEAEGKVAIDDGLKVGCRNLRTLVEIPLPQISLNARVRFAIYVVLGACEGVDPCFSIWAEDWLSGKDRTQAAAAGLGELYKVEILVCAPPAAAWAAWAAEAAVRATAIEPLPELSERGVEAAAARAAWVAWLAAARVAEVAARVAAAAGLVEILVCARAFLALAEKAISDEAAYEARNRESDL